MNNHAVLVLYAVSVMCQLVEIKRSSICWINPQAIDLH
jgi:hypothetical protein